MTMYAHLAGKREFPNVTRFHEEMVRSSRAIEVDGGVAIVFDGIDRYFVGHVQFSTWSAARAYKNEVVAAGARVAA